MPVRPSGGVELIGTAGLCRLFDRGLGDHRRAATEIAPAHEGDRDQDTGERDRGGDTAQQGYNDAALCLFSKPTGCRAAPAVAVTGQAG